MAAQRLRNLSIGIVACLFSALCAFGQGGAITGQVITTQGYPAASVPVRVCPYSSSGNPCTPTASIYSDPGLTVPAANPALTDAYGNYSVFVAAGYYIVQITPSAGITYSYLISSNGSASVYSVALDMPNIFSVAGSPITSGGTFTVTAVSEDANTFWGAPSGAAGVPAFRTLTAADIALAGTLSNDTTGNAGSATTVVGGYVASIEAGTGISVSASTGDVTVSNAGVTKLIAGTNITISPTDGLGDVTINSSNGGGTVTSVGVSSSSPTQLSVTGSPVTGSGTIALAISPTGSEADLVTATGAGTSGDCAQWDAAGGIGDSGAACASSGTDYYFSFTGCTITNSSNLNNCSGTVNFTADGNTTPSFPALPDATYIVNCTVDTGSSTYTASFNISQGLTTTGFNYYWTEIMANDGTTDTPPIYCHVHHS